MSVKKAAFSAAFLRADPTPVAKDSLASFHDALDEVISKGTNTSIQKCKLWLVENAVPSEDRLVALRKYLTSLSLTVTSPEPGKKDQKSAKTQTSPRKKRLHLLYLVNDLLHHMKCHAHQDDNYVMLIVIMKHQLPELMRDAASFDASKNKKLHQKLHDLITIWEENQHYRKEFCNTLRGIAESAGKVSGDAQAHGEETANTINTTSQTATKNVPLALPSTHGDRTAHWSDLPAGCMMRHVAPNSARLIRLREMRQLELNSRSAEPAMVEAAKTSLAESGQTRNPYSHYEDRIIADINVIGQSPHLKDSSEPRVGNISHVWTPKFAGNTKRRQRDRQYNYDDIRGRITARDPNRGNRSPSRSVGPSKRRRLSSYSGDSYSRSRSVSRNRRYHDDRDSSYSRSRPSSGHGSYHSDRRSSYGRSQTRSRSPAPRRGSRDDQTTSNPDPRNLFQYFNLGDPQLGRGSSPAGPPVGVAIPPPPPGWTLPWPPPPPPQITFNYPGGPGDPNALGRGWGMGGQGRGRWARGGWRG